MSRKKRNKRHPPLSPFTLTWRGSEGEVQGLSEVMNDPASSRPLTRLMRELEKPEEYYQFFEFGGRPMGPAADYFFRRFAYHFNKMLKLDLDSAKENAPVPCLRVQGFIRPEQWVDLCAVRLICLPDKLRERFRQCLRCSMWFLSRSRNPRNHHACSVTCRKALYRQSAKRKAQRRKDRQKKRKRERKEDQRYKTVPRRVSSGKKKPRT